MPIHTETQVHICKLTGFSLAFISFFLINGNIKSLNDLLLNY